MPLVPEGMRAASSCGQAGTPAQAAAQEGGCGQRAGQEGCSWESWTGGGAARRAGQEGWGQESWTRRGAAGRGLTPPLRTIILAEILPDLAVPEAAGGPGRLRGPLLPERPGRSPPCRVSAGAPGRPSPRGSGGGCCREGAPRWAFPGHCLCPAPRGLGLAVLRTLPPWCRGVCWSPELTPLPSCALETLGL